MKHVFIVAAVLFSTAAHADQMIHTFYDTIRPHGHKRSDAIGDANIKFCTKRGLVFNTEPSCPHIKNA